MELRILGPLEIHVGRERLFISGTKRQAVLGALLLADGAPVPIDRLIDTVWEADTPATAVKQIRNATSDLRRLHPRLAENLRLAGDGYQLVTDGCEVDAATFLRRTAEARTLLAEGRAEEALDRLRSALALWRGPVLEGLDRPALQAQIAALDELRLVAMEQRVELELAAQNHHALLGELSTWVARHPLRERLVAQYMLALHRSGAQAAALKLFERTRRTLKEELGVSPGADMQEAHRHILQGIRPGSPARGIRLGRNNLPPPAAHFTGRVREQRVIYEAGRTVQSKERPLKPAPVVIAIDGMAGIGKTTLALHAAHHLTADYPDAQLFVDMQAYAMTDRPRDPGTALGILLSGLGVPPERMPRRMDERVALWRRLLADRRALIVLDNVTDTRQTLPLLPTAPGCLTVVTSRNRLTNLMATCHLTVQEMSQSEGRTLFGKIVGDDRPRREPAAVEHIVALCGGLPLAIRLAAAKLRHRPGWSASHLAARLGVGRQWMATLEAEGGSVAEVFRQSYEGLGTAQQQLFRLLGQVPADRIEPRTVAARAGLSVAHAERLLESLVDAHLLSATGPEPRYAIHELVHAFAAQLAGAAQEAPVIPAEQCLTGVSPAGGIFPQHHVPDLDGAG
ncbi:BTAD domain-containing putative transcriptional regulator [Streptomyces sp. NPDC051041]|uniref:AfsR/SARP family transcriptional regulator n=1 Tax=Streptomyces sp. NPDC051041 TaxID=3365640 RepID=UPI0037877540